jgi:carbonic anhydrase
MVHYEKRFNGTVAASKEKNGIAVLGILFHIEADDSELIDKLLKNTGNISETVGKTVPYTDDLRLDEFLPKHHMPLFRYSGSLTTPSMYYNLS